ncbi:hypothetical protein MAR_020820 [Mya arenaria]|uniref:Uncharacterized protein n=1 Tax=Mya arenaria TaxID=6604 RepID=A0ABY7E953_MYAAR|nr:hypothetical protein MAR_020820 [Mya arenaria]
MFNVNFRCIFMIRLMIWTYTGTEAQVVTLSPTSPTVTQYSPLTLTCETQSTNTEYIIWITEADGNAKFKSTGNKKAVSWYHHSDIISRRRPYQREREYPNDTAVPNIGRDTGCQGQLVYPKVRTGARRNVAFHEHVPRGGRPQRDVEHT